MPFSGRYDDTLSVDPRREPGTDLEGSLSAFSVACPCCGSGSGETSWEPDLLRRLLMLLIPGGDTRLDDE